MLVIFLSEIRSIHSTHLTIIEKVNSQLSHRCRYHLYIVHFAKLYKLYQQSHKTGGEQKGNFWKKISSCELLFGRKPLTATLHHT